MAFGGGTGVEITAEIGCAIAVAVTVAIAVGKAAAIAVCTNVRVSSTAHTMITRLAAQALPLRRAAVRCG